MYIETSNPRKEGDKARLLSPLFSIPANKASYGATNTAYCLTFYHNMYGKHIGEKETGRLLIMSFPRLSPDS